MTPPSPVVVIAGTALFICGLVGSLVGFAAYRIAESVLGRKP